MPSEYVGAYRNTRKGFRIMSEYKRLTIPKDKIITVEDWAKENIISGFSQPETAEIEQKLKKHFPLTALSYEDMTFTDEIEDDRINTTLTLSDYDWMSYTFDARFPTEKYGTLAVRFEYFGTTSSYLHIKQFIPAYMSGMPKNYVLYHTYSYPTELFSEYLKKDLNARVDKFDSQYAYSAEDIVLEWFNRTLREGSFESNDPVADKFSWESVRNMKKGRVSEIRG